MKETQVSTNRSCSQRLQLSHVQPKNELQTSTLEVDLETAQGKVFAMIWKNMKNINCKSPKLRHPFCNLSRLYFRQILYEWWQPTSANIGTIRIHVVPWPCLGVQHHGLLDTIEGERGQLFQGNDRHILETQPGTHLPVSRKLLPIW